MISDSLEVTPGPLRGVRVLDFSAVVVGPWAASLLGALGAEVIRVTRPGLADTRSGPPSKNGFPIMEAVVNMNKYEVCLDLRKGEDYRRVLGLVDTADVLLENYRQGTMERLDLGYDMLQKRNPGLIYCSSTSFGTRGRLRGMASYDPQMQAFAGYASINGQPGGPSEATRGAGSLDLVTGNYIVQAILAALFHRARIGRGQHLRLSQLEAVMAFQATRLTEFLNGGLTPGPLGSARSNIVPSQAFLCSDGKWLALEVLTQAHWAGLCRAVGQLDLLNDARFCSNPDRVRHRSTLVPILEHCFGEQPSATWLERLQQEGTPCAPLSNQYELRRHPQVTANRMLVDAPFYDGSTFMVPAWPWSFQRRLSRYDPPPRPGEHTALLDKFLQRPAASKVAMAPSCRRTRPLRRLRVVEISTGMAGAYCAMCLADMGATVFKVEPPGGDWARQAGPPFIEGESPLFLELNRNKWTLPLDISSAEGKSQLRRAIAHADILIAELTPGERVASELDYATLCQANPRLIYAAISPMGEEGPQRNLPGTESTTQMLAGIWRYLGSPGQPPARLGADVVSITAGTYACQGILACLYQRERLAHGQQVSVSLLGSALSFKALLIAAQQNTDVWDGVHTLAPERPPDYGCFASDGTISFLFYGEIEGFRRFCQAIRKPLLASDSRFTSRSGQVLYRQALWKECEPAVRQWKAKRLLVLVQSLGGVAVPRQDYRSLFAHPQVRLARMLLRSRGLGLGPVDFMRLPWRGTDLPRWRAQPPRSCNVSRLAGKKQAV